METTGSEALAHVVARLVCEDLESIGNITVSSRLSGAALLEDDVMFGFVEADGTVFLRTDMRTAKRFSDLGGTKHPEMPYWSVPASVACDRLLFSEIAYEAVDVAHLEFLLTPDDYQRAVRTPATLRRVITFSMVAA